VLYDEFREAALEQDWRRVDALYDQLRTLPLPEELAQARDFHAALAAYNAGDWPTTIQRCQAGLSTESPWRSSLYELLGLAHERLGEVDEALKAYAAADLPSTRVRAQKLRGH
jgi:tetratricopeptide (TPR) repeat protein